VIEKEEKKLNNYTIQHNETKSIDRLSYIAYRYISNNVNININSATDRTSIKYHKIYKDNRERVIFYEKYLWSTCNYGVR